MSWYSGRTEPTPVTDPWLNRAAITVPNTVPAATVDVQVTIPVDWDAFWGSVAAAGADIRVTDGDGRTLLPFEIVGFDATTRACTLKLNGVTLHNAAGQYVLWLYWGNASAGSKSSTQTLTSPMTGQIEVAAPSGRTVRLVPEAPGATRPRAVVQKTSDEELFLWIDATALLARRSLPFAGHLDLEEVWSATVTVQQAGAGQSSMVVVADQRFRYHRRRTWIKARIKAGTDGDDYTGIVTLRTKVSPGDTTNQQLQSRFRLMVRDTSEV